MRPKTRVLSVLVALVVSAPAMASSPTPPPRKIQKVMFCLGFVGIAHNASKAVLQWSGSASSQAPGDTATRALVKATHGEGALIASMVHTVSKLPKKVIDATVRFCATKAGRDYAKVMNGGVDGAAWAKVSKDKRLLAFARRLATVTQVANAGQDESFLALRNAAGARGFVMHVLGNPKEGKNGRVAFAFVYKGNVTAALAKKLHGKGPDTHQALIRATAIGLANAPTSERRALLRFFGSHAGKAVERSLVAGISAAMDAAWYRMSGRFLDGKIAPKTASK